MRSDINYYLQLMGIDVWRLRMPIVNHYYHYDLFDARRRLVGVLLADAILKNTQESQLVEKIAKATKKQVRGRFKTGVPNPDELSKNVIILLGNQVAQLFTRANDARVIRSYAPAKLIHDNDLKCETWDALKKAMWLMRS